MEIKTFKEYRQHKGYTQKGLATAVGMNISQIQKIEAGTIKLENISLKNGIALAKAFDISVEELITL